MNTYDRVTRIDNIFAKLNNTYEQETIVRDLLADLMHWCIHNNINFDHELEIGKMHFEAEI